MDKKRITITAVLILLFAIFLVVAYFIYNNLSNNFEKDGSLPNQIANNKGDKPEKAPDIQVTDQNGNPVSLSDFAGKPVVINFWATWCSYCKEEMPLYEKAYQENKDVVFLIVDCTDGQRETKEQADRYIKENGYTFPIYYDYEGSAIYSYNASALPTSVFIDKDGNLLVYHPGLLTEDMMKKYLDMIK